MYFFRVKGLNYFYDNMYTADFYSPRHTLLTPEI